MQCICQIYYFNVFWIIYLYLYFLLLDYGKIYILLINKYKQWGKVKCTGPKTGGQLFLTQCSVGCRCHNLRAFKELSNLDRIHKTASHGFSITELHWLKENGHFSKGIYVCAGCLAYARTRLKPKLQKKYQMMVVLVVGVVMWLKK